MNKYQELQASHQRLLEQSEETADPKELLNDVQAYIEQIKAGAEYVSDPRERNQLRANLRYWASFVYDHTGNYPNTTMRPASVSPPASVTPQPAAQSGNRRFIILAVGIGGVILLSLICYALYAIVFAPRRSNQQATQVAGINAQNTQVALAAQETSLAAQFTATPTLTFIPPTTTATATPTPTLVIAAPTDVPASPTIDRTATVSALLTEAVPIETALFTPTPIGIASITPIPTLPQTGGGPGELSFTASLVSSGTPAEECGLRTLTITINPIELFSDLDLVAQVELSQGGEVVATGPLPFQTGTITFILPDNTSDAAVLVQVDQPLFLFETVIAQFYSDCSRNQLTLNYQAEFAEELLPDLDEEQTETTTSDLHLSWRLVTWGPSPDKEFWIATLLLDAQGGDGNYIYWASGHVANSLESGLLLDNRFLVSQVTCEPAQLNLGVTSSGRTTQRDMVLKADCIEEQ